MMKKEKSCYYISSYINCLGGKLTSRDMPGGDLPHPPQKGKQTVAGDSDPHTARSLRDLCHWISALGSWGSYPESHPTTPQHELFKTINVSFTCTPSGSIRGHPIEPHTSARSCQELLSAAAGCRLSTITCPCLLVHLYLSNYRSKSSVPWTIDGYI